MPTSADVVVCGAGIAGVAAAYHLAVRHRIPSVVLVDEREPLTLTSDKGTQGYRNWWPGPDETMLRFVSRSIDLLEESAAESNNVFRMNRRGYLFATADVEQAARLETTAAGVSALGMGPLRRIPDDRPYCAAPAEGYAGQPVGADLLRDDEARRAFPYLARDTVAALHIRRAGCLNAIALGNWLLERAIAAGASFVRDRVTGVGTVGGRVREVRLASSDAIATDRFVIAAGPRLPDVAALLGLELPVIHELHAKATIRDTRRALRRDAPFIIWTDPMVLDGQSLPGGVHARPVDLSFGDEVYLIWTFETAVKPFVWPPVFDSGYAKTVIAGAARMIPAMSPYVTQRTQAIVDGGYYCKTPENRPLVGPLPVTGAFVLGALSGYGVMAAHASAELLAAHVADQSVPDYAKWFLPSRYDDPAYRRLVEEWGPLVGQL
jgi:glycine/D-amino acid oxidase-like deaminating enzyme